MPRDRASEKIADAFFNLEESARDAWGPGDVSLTVRFGGLSSKVVCLALRHEAAGHVRRLERMAGRQECRESVCDAVALAVFGLRNPKKRSQAGVF